MPRNPVSGDLDTRVGRNGSGDAGLTDEWCYGSGLLRRTDFESPSPSDGIPRQLPSIAADSPGPSASSAPDGAPGPSGSNPSIPPLGAGEAIRFHDSHSSIRFLWPTDEATDRPFVGVLAGTDGSRYPLYLDRDTAASRCRSTYSIVSTESIPIDPPPHALVASAATDGPLD